MSNPLNCQASAKPFLRIVQLKPVRGVIQASVTYKGCRYCLDTSENNLYFSDLSSGRLVFCGLPDKVIIGVLKNGKLKSPADIEPLDILRMVQNTFTVDGSKTVHPLGQYVSLAKVCPTYGRFEDAGTFTIQHSDLERDRCRFLYFHIGNTSIKLTMNTRMHYYEALLQGKVLIAASTTGKSIEVWDLRTEPNIIIEEIPINNILKGLKGKRMGDPAQLEAEIYFPKLTSRSTPLTGSQTPIEDEHIRYRFNQDQDFSTLIKSGCCRVFFEKTKTILKNEITGEEWTLRLASYFGRTYVLNSIGKKYRDANGRPVEAGKLGFVSFLNVVLKKEAAFINSRNFLAPAAFQKELVSWLKSDGTKDLAFCTEETLDKKGDYLLSLGNSLPFCFPGLRPRSTRILISGVTINNAKALTIFDAETKKHLGLYYYDSNVGQFYRGLGNNRTYIQAAVEDLPVTIDNNSGQRSANLYWRNGKYVFSFGRAHRLSKEIGKLLGFMETETKTQRIAFKVYKGKIVSYCNPATGETYLAQLVRDKTWQIKAASPLVVRSPHILVEPEIIESTLLHLDSDETQVSINYLDKRYYVGVNPALPLFAEEDRIISAVVAPPRRVLYFNFGPRFQQEDRPLIDAVILAETKSNEFEKKAAPAEAKTFFAIADRCWQQAQREINDLGHLRLALSNYQAGLAIFPYDLEAIKRLVQGRLQMKIRLAYNQKQKEWLSIIKNIVETNESIDSKIARLGQFFLPGQGTKFNKIYILDLIYQSVVLLSNGSFMRGKYEEVFNFAYKIMANCSAKENLALLYTMYLQASFRPLLGALLTLKDPNHIKFLQNCLAQNHSCAKKICSLIGQSTSDSVKQRYAELSSVWRI